MEPSVQAPNAATPQQNNPQPPMDGASSSHVNKAIIASLAVVLVALIGITYMFFNKSKGEKDAMDKKGPVKETDKNDKMAEKPAGPLPAVQVSQWKTDTAATMQAQKSEKTTGMVYSLKQSYSVDEINTIAGKLGASERVETTEKAIVGYSSATSSVMMFYPSTGKYMYSSAVGIELPKAADMNSSVTSFLAGIGMYDPTIKVAATYMRQDKPGMKYVELHRSWTDLKLPILNPLGLANLPESTKVAQLSPSTVMPDDPKDASIVSTSDQTDTYKRRDDFNTVTVGVDTATNKVVFISSNVRILAATPVSSSLISYKDALAKIEAKQYDFFISSPAGEGKLDMEKVYPGNTAMSENATITDVALAYVEQPPATVQTMLAPHYVVRGYMETKDGYRLKFTATVNAQAAPSAMNRLINIFPRFNVLAQTGDPGQKQDTLKFPTQGAQKDINVLCTPSEADMNPIYDYNGMRIGYGPRADHKDVYEWWYLNRAGLTEEQILANVRVLFENIPTGVDNSVTFREKVDKLVKEIGATLQNCPVRFTGSSPTVFVYGDAGKEISIVSTASTTYSEPSKGSDKVWDVTIEKNGALDVEGADRSYLYYEYAPVKYQASTQGWNIKRSDLGALSARIAAGLGLTPHESERLSFELNHAAQDVAGDMLTVSPISRQEVDARLPLSVSPAQTRVERVHFAVSTSNGLVKQIPTLSPLVRSNTMVVELGAVAQ